MYDVTPDELARYLAGELSDEDHRRVFRWLQGKPDVRRLLEGIPGSVGPDAEAALLRVREATDRDEHSDSKRRRSRPVHAPESDPARVLGRSGSRGRAADRRPSFSVGRRAGLSSLARRRAGAAVLIAALAALLVWIARDQAAPVTFAAEAGSRRTVELEDGSVVTLNAASRLVLHPDFGDRRRAVTLEGEAYFVVVHDPARPFVVEAGTVTATVLGTSFNMDGYAADRVTVVVGEGRVRMETPEGSAVDLRAGYRGRLESGSGRIAVSRTSIDEAIAWMSHRLVFRATPMRDVAARLEREYDVDVDIPEELVSRRLDATFDGQSIDEVALLIAAALDVGVSMENDRVRFYAREDRR